MGILGNVADGLLGQVGRENVDAVFVGEGHIAVAERTVEISKQLVLLSRGSEGKSKQLDEGSRFCRVFWTLGVINTGCSIPAPSKRF